MAAAAMTAAEVKALLRSRHPAVAEGAPGPWTCLEEYRGIDLLAVSAWASVRPYPRYARVGYEVKVSRADYKRELVKPSKRRAAVDFCHEFYFAVPLGLLTDAEIAWDAPAWLDAAAPPFDRPKCPGAFGAWCTAGRVTFGRGTLRSRFGNDHWCGTPEWVEYRARAQADREGRRADEGRWRSPGAPAPPYSGECPTCRGTGYLVESPAVLAGAPRLWVPADVGLIVVAPGAPTRIAKKPPRRAKVTLPGNGLEPYHGQDLTLSDSAFADLVRWVSVRPDPRHAALRA